MAQKTGGGGDGVDTHCAKKRDFVFKVKSLANFDNILKCCSNGIFDLVLILKS